MTDTHLTQIRFDGFGLDQRIMDGLAAAGFTHCTPIQAATLPIALAGADIAGQAQTGTGKTAAFLLVVMQRLLSGPPPTPTAPRPPRALILAPTRELAVQIHKDTEQLAGHTGLHSLVVFGGTGYQQQRDALAAGTDILIGTPGRLIDYHRQKVFDLGAVQVVVLDEADRMFDLGFIKDVRYLLRRLPPIESRQGMLFSATLSYRVTELAYEHMNDPRLIKVEAEKVTADRVRQCCYMTSNDEKIPLLLGLVRRWVDGRIIVFVNTKREADRVWGYLQGNGIDTAVLSGDVPQKKRLRLLRDFTEGNLPVLVATDVAARGLHIPDVTHVVNYDLPDDPEDYIHRIGRTARAGAAGDAVSFACETYAFCLPDIEAMIGAKIPVLAVDPADLATVDPRRRQRPDRDERMPRREERRGGPTGSRGHEGAERRPPRRRTAEGSSAARPTAARPTARPTGGSSPAPDRSTADARDRMTTDTASPAGITPAAARPAVRPAVAQPSVSGSAAVSSAVITQGDRAATTVVVRPSPPAQSTPDADDAPRPARPPRAAAPRARRPRTAAVEQAALTSPPTPPSAALTGSPVAAATLTEDAAAARAMVPQETGGDPVPAAEVTATLESTTSAKPKRRRRRRKPAAQRAAEAGTEVKIELSAEPHPDRLD